MVSWLAEHHTAVTGAFMALWTLISTIVALTPTQVDDRALSRARRWFELLSFLQPPNSPGTLSLPGKRAPRPEGDPDRVLLVVRDELERGGDR